MVTVSASQITSVGYIDINGSWCADYFHGRKSHLAKSILLIVLTYQTGSTRFSGFFLFFIIFRTKMMKINPLRGELSYITKASLIYPINPVEK